MLLKDKYRFLIKNLAKGVAWFGVLLLLFLYFKDSISVLSDGDLIKYGDRPLLIFLIYSLSEIVVGIIPPELFMMWSLELAETRNYLADLLLLSCISYAAGALSYFFGRYFNKTVFYRYFRKKYLKKHESILKKYGGFLLIVSAVTPVPYAAICALAGSAKFPVKKFFLVTLFRFVRFAVYGYLVWQASMV